MTNNKKTILIIGTMVVLSISISGSYALTKYLTSPPKTIQETTQATTPPTEKPVAKTSTCPLNGKQYSAEEKERWESKHPIGVMIENHPQARPQSGLSAADIVYEAVAEGGITRFLAMYLCDETPKLVGPVRSARTYFLDWLSEYNAFFAHVGGANTEGPANALKQIKDYGIKNFEGLSEDIRQGWQRDTNRLPGVAWEHTMYLDIEQLRKYAKNTWNWDAKVNGVRWDSTFEKWRFKDEETKYEPKDATSAAIVSYQFWNATPNLFQVQWEYNEETKTYKRNMANAPHIDNNNRKQIEVATIIILLQEQSNANDGYENNLHLLYKTIGSGKAYIMTEGKAERATWRKSERVARTKLYNTQGEEIPLTRGKIWISIVPDFNEDSITFHSQ